MNNMQILQEELTARATDLRSRDLPFDTQQHLKWLLMWASVPHEVGELPDYHWAKKSMLAVVGLVEEGVLRARTIHDPRKKPMCDAEAVRLKRDLDSLFQYGIHHNLDSFDMHDILNGSNMMKNLTLDFENDVEPLVIQLFKDDGNLIERYTY